MMTGDCQDDDRCHDCGVPIGQIHHITCDMETCPRCSDQLLKCECCLVALADLTPKKLMRITRIQLSTIM